jgi:restriction system protein
MHWRDFERLVGEAFRRRGFKVTGFGVRGSVGTVDLALTRGGERFLVQCKHWRKPQIGVLLVRELNAAVSAVGARGGYLITAGGFAREARAFARHTPIELIDGQTLGAWVYPICKRAQTRHGQPAAPVTVGLQRASD